MRFCSPGTQHGRAWTCESASSELCVVPPAPGRTDHWSSASVVQFAVLTSADRQTMWGVPPERHQQYECRFVCWTIANVIEAMIHAIVYSHWTSTVDDPRKSGRMTNCLTPLSRSAHHTGNYRVLSDNVLAATDDATLVYAGVFVCILLWVFTMLIGVRPVNISTYCAPFCGNRIGFRIAPTQRKSPQTLRQIPKMFDGICTQTYHHYYKLHTHTNSNGFIFKGTCQQTN